MKKAVARICFFEPMNDASIDPTIELSRLAGNNCLQYQAKLNGPAAHEFMTRYFNGQAKFDNLCKGTSNK